MADPTQIDIDSNSLVVDMRNQGSTGLRRMGGLIFEDPLPQLEGQKGLAIYKEMALNDSMCGAILNAIDKTLRRMSWRTVPASTRWYDRQAEEFLGESMTDMEQPWPDIVSEALSMLPYGHCLLYPVYKRRCGHNLDPSMNSKYRDGRVSWRYMPIRSQDTIYKWHFNNSGDLIAVEQQAPPTYDVVQIPMDKLLLFRTSSYKNNPLGLSIFRSAYKAWYSKRAMENLEGIGVERDLAGIPKAWVPWEIMSSAATPEQKRSLEYVKKMATNLRVDEQTCIVLPSVFDPNGNRLYDLTLMTTGGSRQHDTDKIINRYERQIASAALADFLVVGNGASASGSRAMHTDKTSMFENSLAAYADIISEVMNRVAIPRLFRFNSFTISDYPQIEHGPVARQDLKDLADYVFKLAQSGMQLFPDQKLEEHLRKTAALPPPPTNEMDDMDVMPNDQMTPKFDQVKELHDPPVQQALPFGGQTDTNGHKTL